MPSCNWFRFAEITSERSICPAVFWATVMMVRRTALVSGDDGLASDLLNSRRFGGTSVLVIGSL